MFKKLSVLIVAIVMIAGLTTTAMGQVTLTGNTAGAVLVQALTVVNTTPLHFGVIGITSGVAGTVVMNTAGVRTASTPAITLINTGIQRTVALFSLTGTANAIYTIGLPSTINITTPNGTGDKTMDITTLRVSVDGAGEVSAVGATGTLTAGVSTFLLAGTLSISATQELGVYAGTYDLTVDYQ